MTPANQTICIIHNSNTTLALFRIPYIQVLIERGYEVYCIAPNKDSASSSRLRETGAKVIDVKPGKVLIEALRLNYWALKTLFEKRTNLTFVSHFLVTTLMTSPTLFISPRVICSIEGIGTAFSNRAIRLQFLRYWLRMLCSRRVFMNEYEHKLLGRKHDAILNGIGVDLNKFKPSLNNGSKRTDQRLNILYVGRLIEDKGVWDLFEVARKLINEDLPFTLNIVGDIYPSNTGSLTTEDLENLKNEFGEKLVFHGYKSETIEFYRKADLLLLLSYHEGFPVCIMEASACGTPVIAYDVPGCRHAVKDGVNGHIVPAKDTEHVVKLICQGDFKNMHESSIKYAIHNFDAHQKTNEMISIIEDISHSP